MRAAMLAIHARKNVSVRTRNQLRIENGLKSSLGYPSDTASDDSMGSYSNSVDLGKHWDPLTSDSFERTIKLNTKVHRALNEGERLNFIREFITGSICLSAASPWRQGALSGAIPCMSKVSTKMSARNIFRRNRIFDRLNVV
jgi:hypothetical protein